MKEPIFLIVSFEHNAFWGPNERGYTKEHGRKARATA